MNSNFEEAWKRAAEKSWGWNPSVW
jgi:hypothetical protein